MKVEIFDRVKREIRIIDADVSGDGNKRTLELLKDDPNCTEDNLRFFNLVKIGDWQGMIDQPRVWDDKRVQVTVYGQ